MQLDRPVAAVGQFAPERELAPDGLVEPIEDHRRVRRLLALSRR